jgi:hypothetical protein
VTAEILADNGSLDLVPTMTEALERTWRAIRRRHPEVPDARVRITNGRASSCGSVLWESATIMISTRTVASASPREILGILLHQAAHGLLAARETPDLTGEDRYHSAVYRDAAQSLGLEVSYHHRGSGWSTTTVSDHLAQVYAEQVGQLAQAAANADPVTTAPFTRNGVAAKCSCVPPRTIRMRGQDAAADLAEHEIICSVCRAPFKP